MKPRRVRWICLLGVQVAVEGEEWIFLAIDKYDCPPQGFRPEGEIPRRHCSNSLVYYRRYLQLKYTVTIPEQISICLNRGREESIGNEDVCIVCARKYEMVLKDDVKRENPEGTA